MILLIDNYDSFTWNLADVFRRFTAVRVVRNDELSAEQMLSLQPEGIVLSPGPGRPSASGVSPEVVERVTGRLPVLGICLGHQLLAEMAGARILHAPEPVHGKTSEIFHCKNGIFQDVPHPMTAMRYHSLVVQENSLPPGWEVTARTASGEVMAIRQPGLRLEGVQFHPESILTPDGSRILKNWLCSFT